MELKFEFVQLLILEFRSKLLKCYYKPELVMAPSFNNTDKFQTQVFLFKSMFLLIHLMLQILVLSLMLLLLILVNNKKKEENV